MTEFDSVRDAAAPVKNLLGQTIGRKGAETRARLMRAASTLLEKRTLMELEVADIAAMAGTSAPSFYVYFDDVQDVVLAVAQTIEQITPDIEALLKSEWTEDSASTKALAFVKAYVSIWHQHHAILRVRNLAADEGDKRFEEARHASVERLHDLLSARIALSGSGFEPSAGASAVLALLERIAAILRLPLRRKHASRTQLIQAASLMIANVLAPNSSSMPAPAVASASKPAKVKNTANKVGGELQSSRAK